MQASVCHNLYFIHCQCPELCVEGEQFALDGFKGADKIAEGIRPCMFQQDFFFQSTDCFCNGFVAVRIAVIFLKIAVLILHSGGILFNQFPNQLRQNAQFLLQCVFLTVKFCGV